MQNGFSQKAEIDSIKTELLHQKGYEKVASLNELSWYYKNFNVDSALILANQALEISLEIDSKKAIAASYNSLASALEAKGKLDSALILHQRSLSIKKVLNDTLEIANSLNNIGIVYDELGKYNLSLECYFQALKLYETIPDQHFKRAMVLGNIGIVYKKQKEYPKVLEYYRQALEIYKEIDSDFGKMVMMGNLGSVLIQTKNYEESILYSSEAMQAYAKAGYNRYVPYMKCNLGIAYDSLGEANRARQYYQEAKDAFRKDENEYELSNVMVLLAANYNKFGEFGNALEAAQEALKVSRKVAALEFQSSALNQISRALAGLGKYREAYHTLNSQRVLNDSLFEENKTKQIFELQTQYETEKKEQQIALQEAQISEQEAEIERNQILLAASVLAIILIISLALLQRSRLRKKQQLKLREAQLRARESEINATISSQEKERARYARDLHDGFGQMISILNMNLKNLKGSPKPDDRQKVFEESSKVIDEMYGELKNICFDLMPQTLIKNGLESALKEFTDRINNVGKIFIELNVFGLEQRLKEIQEISLYRITQEWINNILKYSDAQRVTLQITGDEEEITLLIEDDGAGFNKNLLVNGKGNGWKNLNTRTNLIKGELVLETEEGKRGNTLILNAPMMMSSIKERVQIEDFSDQQAE
uniref:ATP-binding protein n=1 Tax=Ekhidna sp. TaxID=2608089 RepID=UPI0032EE60FC